MTNRLVIDHLWQSTVFAAMVWALAWVLRNNSARVRFWLWFTASAKFLVPFALFVAMGSRAPVRSLELATPVRMPAILDEMVEPTTAIASVAAPRASAVDWSEVLLGVWACGALIVATRWGREWARMNRIVKKSRAVALDLPVRTMVTEEPIEPGVFRIFRPVLLLPEGIRERLIEAEFQAVIAHELCHVRRRDSLFAAIHMLTEALFWFHPLIWWIGNRMVEERERACDEEALRSGNDPEIYAEGILKVCELYLAPRMDCVAGVTGADLKKRIKAIMNNPIVEKLNGRKKMLLGGVGTVSFVVPMALGMMNAPAIHAQKKQAFEVASVRLFNPNSTVNTNDPAFRAAPTVFPSNRLTMRFTTLHSLIREAFEVDYRYIFGGPDWLDQQHYDLDAKVEGDARLTREQMQPLLRNLLEERFHLRTHREQKIVAGYALVVAKGGPRLRANKGAPFIGMQGGYTFKFENVSVADFAQYLAGPVKGPVIDKTGIKGMYDFDLKYGPHDPDDPVFARIQKDLYANLPDIFTVLQEKYGLKLVPEKVTIDTLVIDHVDKVPTGN